MGSHCAYPASLYWPRGLASGCDSSSEMCCSARTWERRWILPSQSCGGLACRGGGEEGAAERLGKAGGRVIIFTTLRESVSSIVALLKKKSPLITPRCLGS